MSSRIKWSEAKKYLNKRVLTLVGVCVLLVGAIVANIVLNNRDGRAVETAGGGKSADSVATSTIGGNFFEIYRNERDSVRTQEIAYLDAIVAQGADPETLSDAQRQKLTLINCMELELTLESLVRAKGFMEVAVSMHEGSVNVIVGAASLTDEQVAQILDIVLTETGEKAENVKVSTSQVGP
ncbi:MAG: SpoIIIAH-like family protein [Clostridiales bacterium]|nr:SpoIIIAH-like family protein [Clostridiales bacterium]